MSVSVSELLSKAAQAVEGGDLEGATRALEQALELEPDNLAALCQAAQFYQAVIRDPEKAKSSARRARQMAMVIAAEMDGILEQRAISQPYQKLASRHIGGIIGPY